MVSLLFLTAVGSLAVTLGEDFGPSSDQSMRNYAVYYTNPVLFAITWVKYIFWKYSLGCLKCNIYLYCLSFLVHVSFFIYFLSESSPAVPGSGEATRKSSRLHQPFSLLVSSCSVRHFSFPVARPTGA